VQIRHRPSHGEGVPAEFASHIYYEVHRDCRRRGTKLLQLGKEEAKRLGMKEIIVCCIESNLASKKIIEKNRGIIQRRAPANDGCLMLKYRICLD
jgi:predicted acetyltransferase